MQLTLDNLDGLGAVDYSAALDHVAAPAITRVLNAPSTLKATLCLVGTALKTPLRQGRVVVASDADVVLFTGYLTTEPVAVYAGVASAGPVYRLALHAVSDEWLLDKQAAGLGAGTALAAPAGSVLASLVSRTGSLFVSAGVTDLRSLGVFAPVTAGNAWSAHAGAIAGATFGSYRVLNGVLTLASLGGTTHMLSDGDGTLDVAGLQVSNVRELANDVTVSGAMEANAYWTELFSGDGTTASFALTGEPASVNGGKAVLLTDDFTGETFSRQRWQVADPGSHLGLSADGLTMTGGNGLDGQTTLIANDALELAGSVVVELENVLLRAGSTGVLAGLYSGATAQANCIAGFNIRQSGGQTLAVPLIEGLEAGTSFVLLDGNRYTLRVRLHCAEMVRVKQTYYGRNAQGAVVLFGGGLVDAPLYVTLEARDLGQSSNTPMTVLYDGVITGSPVQAALAVVNSVQLVGSVGSISVTRTGSGWVRDTVQSTGVTRTCLIGTSGEGVDCDVSSSVTGAVTFFAGRIPAVGELVTVLYRGRQRAVARMADAANIAAEAAGAGVGTARWLGKVVQPAARSSEDCENAALAVLNAASNRAAAITGSYTAMNPIGGDIWPGDALTLTANGSSISVIVRQVTVEDLGTGPESLRYQVRFANEWAEELGISLSEAIAADATLPLTALDLVAGVNAGDPPAVPVHVLANLQQMTVTGVSATALQLDMGVDAPAGGGFEVRRRDGGFGTGLAGGGNGDLVLRSPVRGFSIPRAAFEEQFFVRMYDGSATPLYSRMSSAVVTHIPFG